MDVFDELMSIFDLMTPKCPPPGFLDSHTRRGRYVFLDRDMSRRRLDVICAGWEDCSADFEIKRPSFPYPTMELLAGGQWIIGSGKSSRQSGPGTLVLYGPSTPVALCATGPGPHSKYFLVLSGANITAQFQKAGIPAHETILHLQHGMLMDLFEQIISCSSLPEAHKNIVASAIASALILRAGASRLPVKGNAKQDGTAFERCRAYMESHYPEILGIGMAAESCHVTLEHFSRLFRKFTGTTAERFLTALRVNHAARMLQQSNLTVKNIAISVGFKDPYHFSKVFKKIHSVSPQKYRSQFH